jgi:branched-chain amino acid transport system permease protein
MKLKGTRETWGFWGAVVLIFIVGQWLISTGALNDFWKTIILIGGVMAIVSLGLNLIYGYNGQFSLGQWGFFALGAYAAADVTYRWYQLHNASGLVILLMVVSLIGLCYLAINRVLSRLQGVDTLSAFALYLVGTLAAGWLGVAVGQVLIEPVTSLLTALPKDLAMQIVFLISVLLAGLFAAEVSYLFGLPVLALASDYFGIATLGFSIIVKVLLDNSDTLLGFEEMKGARGMVGIPKTTTWFWVCLFVVLTLLVLRNLLQSSHGRAIVSVREDEIAAKAMGINLASQKTLAFVLGSLFAGIAGALYAHINGFLHPNTFNFIKSFDPMIIIVLGGLGSLTGTVFGALAWALILEGVLRIILPQGFETWRFVVYPLLLLIMMLLRPAGLFGTFEVPFLRHVLPPRRKLADQAAPAPAAPEGGR